jgi:hypothetical protein
MFISDFRTLAEPADFTVLGEQYNFLAANRQAQTKPCLFRVFFALGTLYS